MMDNNLIDGSPHGKDRPLLTLSRDRASQNLKVERHEQSY
jgi:hypothetical protein